MPKRTFSQVEQADNMQGKRLRSRIIAHVHARVNVPTTFASSLNERPPAAPDVESMSRPRRSGRLNAGSESTSRPSQKSEYNRSSLPVKLTSRQKRAVNKAKSFSSVTEGSSTDIEGAGPAKRQKLIAYIDVPELLIPRSEYQSVTLADIERWDNASADIAIQSTKKTSRQSSVFDAELSRASESADTAETPVLGISRDRQAFKSDQVTIQHSPAIVLGDKERFAHADIQQVVAESIKNQELVLRDQLLVKTNLSDAGVQSQLSSPPPTPAIRRILRSHKTLDPLVTTNRAVERLPSIPETMSFPSTILNTSTYPSPPSTPQRTRAKPSVRIFNGLLNERSEKEDINMAQSNGTQLTLTQLPLSLSNTSSLHSAQAERTTDKPLRDLSPTVVDLSNRAIISSTTSISNRATGASSSFVCPEPKLPIGVPSRELFLQRCRICASRCLQRAGRSVSEGSVHASVAILFKEGMEPIHCRGARILPLEKRDHEHPPTTVPRARPSIASSNVLSADDLFGDPIPLFDSVGAYNRECFQEGISTGKPFGDNSSLDMVPLLARPSSPTRRSPRQTKTLSSSPTMVGDDVADIRSGPSKSTISLQHTSRSSARRLLLPQGFSSLCRDEAKEWLYNHPELLHQLILEHSNTEDYGFCSLDTKMTNDKDDKERPVYLREGYINESVGGHNKCLPLHGTVAAVTCGRGPYKSPNGKKTEHASHLCGKRTCTVPGHIIWESAGKNYSRIGCMPLMPCHHCDKMVVTCTHEPSCIASIDGVTGEEFAANPERYVHARHEKDGEVLDEWPKLVLVVPENAASSKWAMRSEGTTCLRPDYLEIRGSWA